jgi:excisionase family DNA binding protein
VSETRSVESWETRISRRITTNGEVIVTPRVARWLETHAGITPDWRSRLQDTDPEAYEVLLALHLVAEGRSARGPNPIAGQGQRALLVTWLSTADAARELNVARRTVRRWCRTGRIPATKSGRDWQIRRSDLHIHDLTA